MYGKPMLPEKKSFTWWKIILGLLLLWTTLTRLFAPQTRPFQPTNSAQGLGMFMVDCVIILLGGWLVMSGVRAGLRKPPFSK
jgi:hypothetical protein